jgi:polysaccharide pyruvyl transferase WcaK-like protein
VPKIDAVIVGGGNVFHARPSSLQEYSPVARTAYPSVWLGAASLAAKHGVPLILNSPGVPRKPGPAVGRLMSEVVNRAAYASVRDEASAGILEDAGARNLHVVPDTALGLQDVFGPISDLPDLWQSSSLPDRGHYIAIHLNDRYGEEGLSELGENLDKLSATLKLPLVLVPIGLCHGDLEYARRVARQLNCKSYVFEHNTMVRNVCSVLANSALYVGSSLHAYITAVAYGVPGVLVADADYQHKFSGLLSALGHCDRLRPSWSSATQFVAKGGDKRVATVGVNVAADQVRVHWASVCRAMISGPAMSSFFGRSGLLPVAGAALNTIDNKLLIPSLRHKRKL